MGRKRKEIDREQKETTEKIKKRLKPIHDKGLYSLGEFDGKKGTNCQNECSWCTRFRHAKKIRT